ncbi:MAG: hypothetical protein M9894_04625 [Planctomycetes bacterium]|nr:hypothetical protein [Planctomycetota bacterium]
MALTRAEHACAPAPLPEVDDPRAWLAHPAARRAWLLAWAVLASGDPAQALTLVAPAPPLLRARLAAAAAGLAADADAPAVRAAALALVPDEGAPEGRLVALTLEVDAARRRRDIEDDALLDLLAQVRALSLPPAPDRVPSPVQAEACLLEGEVALALGWPPSAAEAFSRHARLAGDGPAPSPLVVVMAADGGAALAPPDLAAQVGEARARALWLDEAGAAAAAGAARARGRWHPRLGAVSDPAPDARVAARLTAEGLAWLTVAGDDAAALAPARRALLLALRASPEDPAAWAGLARLEALAGRLDAAQAALARARRAAPDGWATLEAAALEALVAGAPARARDEVQAALAALDGADRRPAERALRAFCLLREVHARLEAAGCDVDALALLDLRSRRADADLLPPALRKELHQALGEAAAGLARADLAAAAAERLAAAEQLGRDVDRARRQIAAELRRRRSLIEVLAQDEVRLTLGASPLSARGYLDDHNLGGRLRAGGFDALALAFELDPPAALTYMTSFDPRNVSPEVAATTRASIAALAEPGPRDETLPLARDEALRAALGVLYALEVRAPLTPAAVRAGHAAAVEFAARRPEALAAALALARLQVAVGDHAGALATLPRAAAASPPLRLRSGGGDAAWVLFYSALAHGGLRQWDEARRCLERLVEVSPAARYTLRGHRVRDEPLFWADRDVPGTCPAWALDLAQALDAR